MHSAPDRLDPGGRASFFLAVPGGDARSTCMEPHTARRRLSDLLAADATVDELVDRTLSLGREFLRVENTHLTRTDRDTDYWRAIASTDPPDGPFPAGLQLDLQKTFCRHVIESEESLAVHDVGLGLAIVEGIADAHDWQLTVTDGSGGGARFEIRDVLKPAAPDPEH